jgi:hypothetical protein
MIVDDIAGGAGISISSRDTCTVAFATFTYLEQQVENMLGSSLMIPLSPS